MAESTITSSRPSCTPDGYSAKAANTGTGEAFNFDRLGVRVPAILVSPYIAKGTVVPGTEDAANGRIFEHASIPGTVTNFFLNGDAKRTVREKNAQHVPRSAVRPEARRYRHSLISI